MKTTKAGRDRRIQDRKMKRGEEIGDRSSGCRADKVLDKVNDKVSRSPSLSAGREPVRGLKKWGDFDFQVVRKP